MQWGPRRGGPRGSSPRERGSQQGPQHLRPDDPGRRGGVAGEAAARVTITCPESEREEQGVTITCPESEREEQGVTITCPEGEEEEQRPTIQVSVSGIVYRGAAAKQERVQPQEQRERVPGEGGEGVPGQDGTGKEEEGTRTVQQQQQ